MWLIAKNIPGRKDSKCKGSCGKSSLSKWGKVVGNEVKETVRIQMVQALETMVVTWPSAQSEIEY